jgi:two-component system phosphate regulon response regulator PhoB
MTSKDAAVPSVLIVEDEKDPRRFMVEALKGRASRILEADSPPAALESMRRHRPDVLLLDLHFERSFCGRELVDWMRTAARKVNPRTVIYTVSGVYWTLDCIIDFYRAGVDGFFSKPFDLCALQDAVAVAGEILAGPENGRRSARPEILLITDDRQSRGAMAAGLRREGFSVRWARFGSVGLIMAHKFSPDAIVLDTEMHQDLGGVRTVDMLKILKAAPRTSRALLATLEGDKKSAGQRAWAAAGASYFYNKKDFVWGAVGKQLRQRISEEPIACGNTSTLGRLVLSFDDREAYVDGKPIGLGPKEFGLLACLMKNSPRIVEWADIRREVWGKTGVGTSCKQNGTMHVTLNHLGTKMGPASRYIKVHRGFGVSLVVANNASPSAVDPVD